MKKLLDEWNSNLVGKYEYYNDLISQAPSNGKVFQGFKVWYSNNINNPEILLLGINPGINEGGENRPINIDFSSELEYLADNPNYTLANQIKKAFANADFSDVLRTSTMKTNFYHLITPKMSDLDKLSKIKDGLRKEYERDSEIIIKSLIETLNPKYIICEGVSVFWKLVSIYNGHEELEWIDDNGYCKIASSKLVILGFARRRSYIKNMAGLSNLLGKIKKGDL